MQYIFDHYVEAVEKLGDNFDFDTMTPYLDKALVKTGLKLNSKTYLNKMWAELRKGTWTPCKEKLNTFLNVLPPEMLKKNLTDKIVKANLDESDWGGYRAHGWIKIQKASEFITENNLHDNKPVTIVKREGKVFTVSVFLGDQRNKAGAVPEVSDKAYAAVYDAVAEEIGKPAVDKKLKRLYADNYEITNWPDITDLNDTEYEIIFTPDDDWADSLVFETAEEVAAEIHSIFV
jgi:hypothetical protein